VVPMVRLSGCRNPMVNVAHH